MDEQVTVTPVMMPVKIAEAVLKTQTALGILGKSERNPFGNYQYVSIDKYYELVASVATKHGLSWFSQEIGSTLSQVPTKNEGATATVAKFEYMFTMFHVSGEAVPVYDRISIYHPMQGAQTSGSAASYAEKLFMRKAFKVVTGEQDADASDGDQFLADNAGLDMGPEDPPDSSAVDSKSTEKETARINDAGNLEVLSRARSPEPDTDGGAADLEEKPITGEDAGDLGPDAEETAPTDDRTDPKADAPATPATPENGTLDPKAYVAADEDGTLILHEIKDPDKADWSIVKSVFETFIPDCKHKGELKSFWNKNTKALDVLKEHSAKDHKALVKIFKETHTKIADEPEE